ncbi:MAG: hypothetical protein ACLP0J_25115 [Solirubrobacteraceae bacterium]
MQTLRDAEQLTALPVDRAVASAFATLAVEMRAAGHGNLGVQGAWIAATAIAYDAALLTQDAGFDVVPSLRVIKLKAEKRSSDHRRRNAGGSIAG